MEELPGLLARGALYAAPRLVGALLLRRFGPARATARIVETEAYLSDDPASHSFAGPTRRNASMFEPAGTAYVYRIHRSVCFNIVTGATGSGEAVLVRAVEPLEGIELLRAARHRDSVAATPPGDRDLSNGPGKLCQALEIDMSFNGCRLLEDERLTLRAAPEAVRVATSVRIGISRGRELPYRFYDRWSTWVSRR